MIDLMFLHPRESRVFEAEVGPATTALTCVQNLIEQRFLETPPRGRPYSLQVTRTQRQIPPETTMREAGVRPGDSLAIHQMEQGA